jgi:hypothetical protein
MQTQASRKLHEVKLTSITNIEMAKGFASINSEAVARRAIMQRCQSQDHQRVCRTVI